MSQVLDVIQLMKEYKRLKRKFSLTYGYPERVVQKAFDQFAIYAADGGGAITAARLVELSEPVDSLTHDIFDWTKPLEYRLAQADAIMEMLPYFFTTNNKLFSIEKVD
jgi:hypothetical protein